MFYQSIYLFLSALTLAFLEVQIEGKFGWAGKLPTWRPGDKWYSKIFKSIMGGKEMTGYHLGVFGLVALFLHYPFFVGIEWSLKQEAWTISIFFLFSAVWDYLWIIINPFYGVLKSRPKDKVWWHKKWIGPFPRDYYFAFIFSFLILSPWWWGDWQNFDVAKDWAIVFIIFAIGTVITLFSVEAFRGDVKRQI